MDHLFVSAIDRSSDVSEKRQSGPEQLPDPIEAVSSRAGTESVKPERTFSSSILISGVRCLLTYVIFPFVAPIVGIASGLGSALGLVVGSVAIASNLFSIGRFWRTNHRWKWPVSLLNAGIIVLLMILLVIDLQNLA